MSCSYPGLGELMDLVKPGCSKSHITRYYGDTFLAAIDKVADTIMPRMGRA